MRSVPKRVVSIGLVALVVGAVSAWAVERPRSVEIPFEHLPYSRVDFAPGAPEGFPNCSPDMLDIRIEDTERNVDITFRPLPGIQCGVQVFPAGWWVDATGQRFQARTPDSTWLGRRILLMGRNGASDAGGIEKACTMEAPLTYYLELAGEPFEVGTIDKQPECWGDRERNRLYAPHMLYRDGGLETPAGSLATSIENVEFDEAKVTFTFRLTNDTDEDIELSRCPLVDVELQTSNMEHKGPGFRTYLNCPAAPDVAEPGISLLFTIEAPLAETGDGDLLEVEFRDENRVLGRVTQEIGS